MADYDVPSPRHSGKCSFRAAAGEALPRCHGDRGGGGGATEWDLICFSKTAREQYLRLLWEGQNKTMAATRTYKLDDGSCHPTNCFPARSLLQPHYKEGAGHWEVARHAAEETKFEWWFGPKSCQIKWRGAGMLYGPRRRLYEKTLTGTLLSCLKEVALSCLIFQMKLHHVKSPSHLCSADISNQNFVSAKEEDFEQFDSVAYMNATENLLSLEVFRKFPALRELELSLNGLRNLKVNAEDFPHLEILDLSYNNLSPEDIRALGVLPHLKVLHLTANGLSSLPLDLAVPESKGCPRFPALEVLLLDDNHLSHPNVFVSLANLRSLKQLNLDRNGIKEVPYLHHLENSRFSIHPLSAKSGIREGLRTRKSAEVQRKRDVFSGRSEQADCVVVQSSLDLDRADLLFATCSPDPSVQGDTPLPRSVSKISSTSFGQDFALPLMELRYLSLANNEIEQEEDLLAVALFPSLTELTFYGNPFTTSRSGDPPLLTGFLQDKLGIKLVRRKISKLEKPRIFIPTKTNRKVKSPLPKVRKHPPILEAPLETSFWELWTGTESLLDMITSLDKSEPLPPISRSSAEKRPAPLSQEESVSEPFSMVTFPSEDDTLVSQALEIPSLLVEILSASLPSHTSFVDEQSQSELAELPVLAPADQGLSQSLLPTRERSRSEIDAPDGMPSMEQEGSELIPPPGSCEPEANPLEHSPPTEHLTVEEDQSKVLQPIGSAVGQPVSPPDPPSEQQAVSEPVLFTGSPPGEQDLPGSLPRITSTSEEQNLPETSPSAESMGELNPVDSLSRQDQGLNLSESISLGRPPETNLSRLVLPPGPPLENWDLLHLAPSQILPFLGESMSGIRLSGIIPPTNSLISDPGQLEPTPHASLQQAQDLLEPASPRRLSSEHPDLSEPLLPVPTLAAAQDQPESVASSSFQEQVPPDSIPPTGPPVAEQNSRESILTPKEQKMPEASPPLGEQDQTVVQTSPELSRPDAELPIQLSPTQEEPSQSVPEVRSCSDGEGLAAGVSWTDSLPEGHVASELSLHGRSSSGDLRLLYERKLSLTSLSSGELDETSSSNALIAERMQSFFITQVAETSVPLQDLKKEEMPPLPQEEASAPQPVPKRYKGYEELLDGPTDPDFIEPKGMQQNVKALEWALRHPLVYREPRARLDSFQKPYVPMEKKVLRVPVPPVRKTKAQELEEVLQEMQAPTNIIELPLVCILRKKKSNWREYREALLLLKDFRKKYKAAVTTTKKGSSTHKKQSGMVKQSQTQTLTSLTEVKTSGTGIIKAPPAQPSKDDEKDIPPPLGERA
ncbi:X-ray radiation resistance-associated protein 1 [Heteronotia binoei]|uniref:X-ray radiation resistance-associated protein 1 n=1 Tax=Heteronotia binoei TaxID=13085 RepID=UPI0029307A3B|nr:X-ray radiation resistance-associated protein 1 [Heteronotia binoei]